MLFEMLKSEELNYDIDTILNVDDKIKHLSMSFIEGFFHEILINIGIKGIKNKLIVNSKIPYLKNIIVNNLI